MMTTTMATITTRPITLPLVHARGVKTYYALSFIGATRLLGRSVVDGTGQIVLDDLQCTGSESRLIDCPHNGLGNHNCDHTDDAGVRCAPGMICLINLVLSYVVIFMHAYSMWSYS